MATISFSGIASGIDGDAIIKALMDARRLADAPLRTRVENNSKETSALEEFNKKLLTLSDALQDLRTISGGALAKTAQSSNVDALGVSAGSDAIPSTTTVSISQLAKSGAISFSDAFSSVDAVIAPGLESSGTLSVTTGAGGSAETVSVEVSSTTTLTGLISSLNEAGNGKLRAFAVNVGSESSPQFKLVMSAVKSGLESGTLAAQTSGELTDIGLFQTSTVQAAQDAVLTVAGIGTITRSNNQISDLIPGVTLDLKQENTGPINVSVGSDTEKTSQKLAAVVEAFNEVIAYSKSNSAIERVEDEKGVRNEYGSLARSNVDEQVLTSLRQALSQATSQTADSKVRIFADIGITTERDGSLKFNAEEFGKAMAADPTALEQLVQSFADKTSSTNGVIDQYTRFQGAIDFAKRANEEETKRTNDKLARSEEMLLQQEQALKLTFARLESTISRLNSQSEAVVGLISGNQQSR